MVNKGGIGKMKKNAKNNNQAIDAQELIFAMKELEKSNNKRDIYKVFICVKCGMRREIKNDKRYFLA